MSLRTISLHVDGFWSTKTVKINPELIVSLEPYDDSTVVTVHGGACHHVNESPDQIEKMIAALDEIKPQPIPPEPAKPVV